MMIMTINTVIFRVIFELCFHDHFEAFIPEGTIIYRTVLLPLILKLKKGFYPSEGTFLQIVSHHYSIQYNNTVTLKKKKHRNEENMM